MSKRWHNICALTLTPLGCTSPSDSSITYADGGTAADVTISEIDDNGTFSESSRDGTFESHPDAPGEGPGDDVAEEKIVDIPSRQRVTIVVHNRRSDSVTLMVWCNGCSTVLIDKQVDNSWKSMTTFLNTLNSGPDLICCQTTCDGPSACGGVVLDSNQEFRMEWDARDSVDTGGVFVCPGSGPAPERVFQPVSQGVYRASIALAQLSPEAALQCHAPNGTDVECYLSGVATNDFCCGRPGFVVGGINEFVLPDTGDVTVDIDITS